MIYEKITQQELDNMRRSDGITPNYTYEDFIIARDDQGELIEEYYVNLTIHKTANEVYEKSLLPPKPETDKIQVLEEKLLKLEDENKRLWDTNVHLVNTTLDQQEKINVLMAMRKEG